MTFGKLAQLHIVCRRTLGILEPSTSSPNRREEALAKIKQGAKVQRSDM